MNEKDPNNEDAEAAAVAARILASTEPAKPDESDMSEAAVIARRIASYQ